MLPLPPPCTPHLQGYTLRGLKFLNVSKSLAETHYADLSSKPFFGGECAGHSPRASFSAASMAG